MNDSVFSSTSSRIAILLAGLIGFGHVMALDVDELEVTKEGRTYNVQMTFNVAAPADRVVEVLTDFEQPDLLNPEVESRVVVSQADGVTRVRTERRSCLFLFCRDIRMTQDVTVVGGIVQADIVPDDGHFRSGTMRWVVSGQEDGSAQVAFTAIMEPDVFIPPLFGRFLVRKMLKDEVMTTATNLEIAAACAIALTACASQEATHCALAPEELDEVRANAVAYLLQERPAIDEECETLADDVVAVDGGKCAIAGGPTGAAGCGNPSYIGYSIVFDRDTLEPEKIYFKTE